MSKYPVLNGFAAAAYILIIVSVMTWGTKMVPRPDTFMAPLAAISLFTLSAAVMGYLFCYQPIQLYFEGKKKLAVQLFLQTVMVFGCITALILALLFTGAFAA
jgi:hypothetical protein